jgi:acyl-CoA-binding protein
MSSDSGSSDAAADQFQAAANYLASLTQQGSSAVSDADLLRFYGLYKQGTLGQCTTGKPSVFDVKGRAKWAAWAGLGDMPAEVARLEYVELLQQVQPGWDGGPSASGRKPGGMGAVVSTLSHQPSSQMVRARCASASRLGRPWLRVWCIVSLGIQYAVFVEGWRYNVCIFAYMTPAERLTPHSRPTHGCLQFQDSAQSPFFAAVSRGVLGDVRRTLAEGQDIGERDGEGCTALHWAADKGRTEVSTCLMPASVVADPITLPRLASESMSPGCMLCIQYICMGRPHILHHQLAGFTFRTIPAPPPLPPTPPPASLHCRSWRSC